LLYVSVLRHWPNNLKNFGNFETFYDGPKRKRFAHLDISAPVGVGKGRIAAPFGAVAGACVEAPLPGLSASFRCQRGVNQIFFLAPIMTFFIVANRYSAQSSRSMATLAAER